MDLRAAFPKVCCEYIAALYNAVTSSTRGQSRVSANESAKTCVCVAATGTACWLAASYSLSARVAANQGLFAKYVFAS